MAELGFEFVDLTLEPPAAAVWKVDLEEVRRVLAEYNLPVVGHTAYYLPLCSPFESIRKAAVQELKYCIEAFAQLGAEWMNIHPDRNVPMHDRKWIIERNIQSLRELLPVAEQCGVGLMIENLPGEFNTLAQLAQLLDPLPSLGLHLDIGHANLMVEKNTTGEIIETYGSRMNRDEIPDLVRHLRTLKQCGYDGTITLEVFTADRHFLSYSRDVLRKLWDEIDATTSEIPRSVAPTVAAACCDH